MFNVCVMYVWYKLFRIYVVILFNFIIFLECGYVESYDGISEIRYVI